MHISLVSLNDCQMEEIQAHTLHAPNNLASERSHGMLSLTLVIRSWLDEAFEFPFEDGSK